MPLPSEMHFSQVTIGCQHRFTAAGLMLKKFITLKPFVVSRSVSNRWKPDKLFYISHDKVQVLF
jgi:hypothetical protein